MRIASNTRVDVYNTLGKVNFLMRGRYLVTLKDIRILDLWPQIHDPIYMLKHK